MSAPSGPVAYATVGLNAYPDGHATLTAYGVIIGPGNTLAALADGWTFSVEVPLAYGADAASLAQAIGAAIAAGYGGPAPGVVLLSAL